MTSFYSKKFVYNAIAWDKLSLCSRLIVPSRYTRKYKHNYQYQWVKFWSPYSLSVKSEFVNQSVFSMNWFAKVAIFCSVKLLLLPNYERLIPDSTHSSLNSCWKDWLMYFSACCSILTFEWSSLICCALPVLFTNSSTEVSLHESIIDCFG